MSFTPGVLIARGVAYGAARAAGAVLVAAVASGPARRAAGAALSAAARIVTPDTGDDTGGEAGQ